MKISNDWIATHSRWNHERYNVDVCYEGQPVYYDSFDSVVC